MKITEVTCQKVESEGLIPGPSDSIVSNLSKPSNDLTLKDYESKQPTPEET